MHTGTLTPQQVSAFYADQSFDLAGAYEVLLVRAGFITDLPPCLLLEAAARVLSSALNVLHERLHIGFDAFEVLRVVGDPLRFAWRCLTAHVARLTPMLPRFA